MMRSFYAGISGLRNHQIRMDVIGNNIANVNTIGFKANRANFADVLYQTIGGSSSPGATIGGINPKQVGLGATLASIDTVHTQGNVQPTGRTEDMAIEGDGFFALQGTGGGLYYTRAGAFSLDQQGYLVNPSGYRVIGYQAVNGTISKNYGPIVIDKNGTISPTATTGLTFGGNLNSEALDGEQRVTTHEIYDSKGQVHDLEITFEKQIDGTWNWTAAVSDPALTVTGNGNVSFAADGTVDTVTGTDIVIDDGSGSMPNGADQITIDFNLLDFSGLRNFAKASSANIESQNGYPDGSLTSIEINPSGVISGLYSNGQRQDLAQVAIAVCKNPGGLTKVGNTMFQESNNSGSLIIGKALTDGRGIIKPSSVEMSNVDLSEQFSEMIITQRGFQANSRVITTSDEMLQELVNLKR